MIIMKRKGIIYIILFIYVMMVGCNLKNEYISYYSVKENYVEVEGSVYFLEYSENGIYIGFQDMTYEFDDDCFKLVGKNMTAVVQAGVEKKLKLGDKVKFSTAPKYFGDGYVMPIVSLEIEGEELLSFEDGYVNLLEWYRN